MVTGKRIAMLRKEKGWGQKQLASHLNVSVSTISNYEQNVHAPDLETLGELADLFEVSADYLLGRTDSRSGLLDLNEGLTGEYTFQNLADIVLAIDAQDRKSLMQFAMFLKLWPDKGSQD